MSMQYTAWLLMSEEEYGAYIEEKMTTERCIRCGRELTSDICGHEFIETGVCADCWTPEDEEES
jgi:DNA-directed RNA polymerase subunit RPC12/RpoP